MSAAAHQGQQRMVGEARSMVRVLNSTPGLQNEADVTKATKVYERTTAAKESARFGGDLKSI